MSSESCWYGLGTIGEVRFYGHVGDCAAVVQCAERPMQYDAAMKESVSHDAALAAQSCQEILADGGDLLDLWRFGILQTIDYYTSYFKRGGPTLASHVFDQEPLTGHASVDAAFAALADYLATRDGWAVPTWVASQVVTPPWFVAPIARRPGYFHDEALRVTPDEFRRRNIYIGIGDLSRA